MFVEIGIDGGLLAQPMKHDHIEMSPAQRFHVIVDFSTYQTGANVTLLNDFAGGCMAQVMSFVVGTTSNCTRIVTTVGQPSSRNSDPRKL